MTEISRISVVMYVSDQFVDGKLQLTDYRVLSTKLELGVLSGDKMKTTTKTI